MKNLIRILAAISIVLLIGFSTGCSNSTENSQDKITVGAIRWDAWHQPTKNVAHGGWGGPVKAWRNTSFINQ